MKPNGGSNGAHPTAASLSAERLAREGACETRGVRRVFWARELAFDAVQKQLADDGVELSLDQLRKGSAERPEETLHRALDLGYGPLTSGGVWLVVDKIRSFLRCLCIAGADDRHVAALHLSVASFKYTYKNQLANAFEEVLPFNSQIDAQQSLLTRLGEVMDECRAKQVVQLAGITYDTATLESTSRYIGQVPNYTYAASLLQELEKTWGDLRRQTIAAALSTDGDDDANPGDPDPASPAHTTSPAHRPPTPHPVCKRQRRTGD